MRDYDNFIEIPFNTENLDRFYVRESILNALKANIDNFKGRLLDVGCGRMPYRKYIVGISEVTEYIGLDIETALDYGTSTLPDFTWDGVRMPFSDNSFESAIATEVLEHCPFPLSVLKEVNRVLQPEGVAFFTIPFLWPLHEVPYDEYRYTPFAIERLLKEAGFINIQITATGGWHAALAQMLGLWVRRAPLGKTRRHLLSQIFKPLITLLLRWDKYSTVEFKEGQMITGLAFTGYKP